MCLNANFIPEQQPSVGTVRPTAPLRTSAALFIAVVHLAVNYAWSEGHHHHHRQRHHRSACGWPSFIFAKAADRWVHKGRCCTVLCTRLVDFAAVGEVFVIVFLIAESVRLCLSRGLAIIISSIKTHTHTHGKRENKSKEKGWREESDAKHCWRLEDAAATAATTCIFMSKPWLGHALGRDVNKHVTKKRI